MKFFVTLGANGDNGKEESNVVNLYASMILNLNIKLIKFIYKSSVIFIGQNLSDCKNGICAELRVRFCYSMTQDGAILDSSNCLTDVNGKGELESRSCPQCRVDNFTIPPDNSGSKKVLLDYLDFSNLSVSIF